MENRKLNKNISKEIASKNTIKILINTFFVVDNFFFISSPLTFKNLWYNLYSNYTIKSN